MNPVLMAAAEFSGGVMGKMISLQSVAVAAAATVRWLRAERAALFRFTLKHSVLLTCVIGLIVMFYRVSGAPRWRTVRLLLNNASAKLFLLTSEPFNTN